MMDAKREELWRNTSASHSRIQTATFELQSIARAVSYLHPNLAEDLEVLATDIEYSRKQIQGNDSELLNMDLADSQRFMGETLMALLDSASKHA